MSRHATFIIELYSSQNMRRAAPLGNYPQVMEFAVITFQFATLKVNPCQVPNPEKEGPIWLGSTVQVREGVSRVLGCCCHEAFSVIDGIQLRLDFSVEKNAASFMTLVSFLSKLEK